MDTTIQVSSRLRGFLQKRKMHPKESYEEVIWDALEDSMEISEQTKLEIEQSRMEVSQGNFKTMSQVRKELGL